MFIFLYYNIFLVSFIISKCLELSCPYPAITMGSSMTPTASSSSPALPSPTSTDPGRGTNVPQEAGSPSSQAWVAGAVAGPVIGCVLVGLLVWGIMRHRMKKATAASTAEATISPYGHHRPPGSSPPPPPSHGNTTSHGWESQNKSALPGSGGPLYSPYELSSVSGNLGHNGAVHELHHNQ